MYKYLLAIDESENALRAVNYMLNLAKVTKGLEIVLIHVVNFKQIISSISPFMVIPDIQAVLKEQGRKLLDERAAIFEDKGITINRILAEGDPGIEIAKYAANNDIDHIVLGTRGLSNLKGLVMGSVSHQIIHLAQCPVTLIK
ncbi:UspA domain protein [Desulfofarcimen acetoxidans DSM 771]|uniref:UspA domain protein n=1 Tax=Desulfofarcimen acetoxidans (strain ATCC 49208 / DSM 771 / KCTC 5769 / VKM B-1644 / 5575) TaxID=485916 RepID=C8VXC4_DESAS|nr:universal stress protein [Desulfofarcimen acetoxidans]ACV64520.1 UspA domain protein [Desulfofarcimen acetoxidans DSM 771]